jgi:hypothetical protein
MAEPFFGISLRGPHERSGRQERICRGIALPQGFGGGYAIDEE